MCAVTFLLWEFVATMGDVTVHMHHVITAMETIIATTWAFQSLCEIFRVPCGLLETLCGMLQPLCVTHTCYMGFYIPHAVYTGAIGAVKASMWIVVGAMRPVIVSMGAFAGSVWDVAAHVWSV